MEKPSEERDRILDSPVPAELLAHLVEHSTCQDLSDLCGSLKLPTSGKKDVLIQRILSCDRRPPWRYFQVDELRDLCDVTGKSRSGNKPDLVKRLDPKAGEEHGDSEMKLDAQDQLNIPGLLRSLTVDALKDLCDVLDLKVSGNKEELVERIAGAKPTWEDFYKEDLQDMCAALSNPTSGTKLQLAQRLGLGVAPFDQVREVHAAHAHEELESELLCDLLRVGKSARDTGSGSANGSAGDEMDHKHSGSKSQQEHGHATTGRRSPDDDLVPGVDKASLREPAADGNGKRIREVLSGKPTAGFVPLEGFDRSTLGARCWACTRPFISNHNLCEECDDYTSAQYRKICNDKARRFRQALRDADEASFQLMRDAFENKALSPHKKRVHDLIIETMLEHKIGRCDVAEADRGSSSAGAVEPFAFLGLEGGQFAFCKRLDKELKANGIAANPKNFTVPNPFLSNRVQVPSELKGLNFQRKFLYDVIQSSTQKFDLVFLDFCGTLNGNQTWSQPKIDIDAMFQNKRFCPGGRPSLLVLEFQYRDGGNTDEKAAKDKETVPRKRATPCLRRSLSPRTRTKKARHAKARNAGNKAQAKRKRKKNRKQAKRKRKQNRKAARPCSQSESSWAPYPSCGRRRAS